ncbi:unnamed protein product [Urochloa decumbens]|uniref:Transposase n=1 Tax=Urochloa decumbens TaxID=240449 RepID=A0ABC9BCG5_9POAL
MMRDNRVFRSLGLTEVASILSSSSNAKSKVVARKDPDPLYEPVDDDEDNIEHGVVDKVPETSVVRHTGVTRGSEGVLAGPTEEESVERVMTRKMAREQTIEGGTNGPSTNEEGDAVLAAPAQADEHEEGDIHEGQRTRGRSMGKGLERMSRCINNKLPVVIVDGMRSPEAPMQAAKLASEGGIVLRQHMPIHTHWKDYKKDKSILNNFVGKISAEENYFDDVPASQVRTNSPLNGMTDDQWKALVEIWSSPKHKEKCLKAKAYCEKVKYPHKTGSRCYIAQTYVVKQKDTYKDEPPTAIDLFSDLHCSSKTGHSEPVKEAIEIMKAIVAEPTEGQDPKSATQVVAEVLPKSKFLKNVGLLAPAPKKSATTAVQARVQELEAEVKMERQDSAALRCQIKYQKNQLEAMMSKFEGTEAAN